MSKTIPIWCCVLNRSIFNYLNRLQEKCSTMDGESNAYNQQPVNGRQVPFDWDCSLHLPIWVSETERASIGDRLEEWTQELEASGVDIASLASSLKKPLRPLWVSQKTVIWLNEVPEYDAWDFTPIILVCASTSNGIAQNRISSEFSWNYISGAGDDEESWARGLPPSLFWSNVYDLINSSPDLCNQKVADIVEKDRVYRAQRGQDAPQISVKPSKLQGTSVHLCDDAPVVYSEVPNLRTDVKCSDEDCAISWLGSTNLAVGASQHAANVSNVDCILNCDKGSVSVCLPAEAYMHIPIVNSKMDRFCLLNNLPSALKFAKLNLSKGKTLLVCCHNGEDISICICLAILASLYNEGTFDDGKCFNETCITKLEMRRRLVFICQFATNARPSRGNLKQVFSFLSGGRLGSAS